RNVPVLGVEVIQFDVALVNQRGSAKLGDSPQYSAGGSTILPFGNMRHEKTFKIATASGILWTVRNPQKEIPVDHFFCGGVLSHAPILSPRPRDSAVDVVSFARLRRRARGRVAPF